tara:strand:- start:3422 stop:4627 length:1206 start_codon:yes stop_codon:yes gene_type:complete
MSLRDDFPIFKNQIRNNPITYLDSAASTQKPKIVIEAIKNFYENSYENVHRGMNSLSISATDHFERARENLREFINAKSINEIIFTSGATDSINILANALVNKFKDGGEIVVSELEHHSNYLPWLKICDKSNLKLKIIPIDENGAIDEKKIIENCNSDTKVLAITHMSNTTGQIIDLNFIKKNISTDTLIAVDGCQSIAHCDIDVQKMNCDFFSFSSHKIYGPSGVGVLYGKESLLNDLEPSNVGGGMINQVNSHDFSYAMLPNKFEAGTPPIEAVVGFSAAIDYVKSVNFKSFFAKEKKLRSDLIEALKDTSNIEIYGSDSSLNASSIVSFNLIGHNYNDIATFLDQYGIMIRGGHHCCQPFMKKLDIPGSCRASFGIYNDTDDIDIFIDSLKKTIKLLQ